VWVLIVSSRADGHSASSANSALPVIVAGKGSGFLCTLAPVLTLVSRLVYSLTCT
jgi:hypothetical protein